MPDQKVHVLRLGHRQFRDERATTHLFLAARALGAEKVIYSGQRDERLEETVDKVVRNWGGRFKVEHSENWKKTMENWRTSDGETIHLTMYGLAIQDVIGSIRKPPRDKLVIVGGAKVPREVFKLVDWNVSVTSQPHSEISALSIFLHELYRGRELSRSFEDAAMEIVPQEKGKMVIRKKPKINHASKRDI